MKGLALLYQLNAPQQPQHHAGGGRRTSRTSTAIGQTAPYPKKRTRREPEALVG